MENVEAAYLAGIIDGEGSITLTRMHSKEFRRPCISIASTDLELLSYINSIVISRINYKKNYYPDNHKNSYTLTIKKKETVMFVLSKILPYLRIERKIKRTQWILDHYNIVTPRNGKYTPEMLKVKLQFEEVFFDI
ncbi:LAGLIDADG family homing endonuclease [Fictibacillus halophilus]|uniref:LAGLIDADG family homing endonuclease n=1 Tax=Fictibacillus halophilus TaxID=1610490 RepID=UPI003643FAF2